jgi:imidazolonepropionase-like amidohydrolase
LYHSNMTRNTVPIIDATDMTVPASTASSELRIDADLLIPGRGDPIKNATLICGTEKASDSNERGKIVYVGSTSDVSSKYSTLSATKVPVLMPGLWDAHVHYFGQKDLNLDAVALIRPALSGMRAARDVAATLNAGYTSVREVGGYGIDFSQAINEGWIPGPHIYSAGAPLSQTAGHGDLHTLPIELMHHKMHGEMPLHLADGVEEAIKAVRLQIRRGAKLIKICATGGVLSRIDSPRAAQFNKSELEAIVEEATRTSMYVAAHAHGTEGIIAALKAGVMTIEHGSYLTDEAIELMKEKGAILVATRFIQVHGTKNPNIMPEESFKKILEVNKANKKSYQKAVSTLAPRNHSTPVRLTSNRSKRASNVLWEQTLACQTLRRISVMG